MKVIFVIFSYLAILATGKGDTIASVLPGGNIANTCAWYSYQNDSSTIYQDQECRFGKDCGRSTKFKYCYFSFIEEDGPDCIDNRLVKFLLPEEQYTIFEQCEKDHLEKCCNAEKEERPTACLDLMNCLIYCSLKCKDSHLCTLEKTETIEKRSHHSRSHRPILHKS